MPGTASSPPTGVVLVERLQEAGRHRLLGEEADAQSRRLTRRRLEHLLRVARRVVVEAEHHGALDRLTARRHRRIAVCGDLAVELLEVLDEALLRLHAVGGARERAGAHLLVRKVDLVVKARRAWRRVGDEPVVQPTWKKVSLEDDLYDL